MNFYCRHWPTKKDSWPECEYCPPEPEWHWGDGWWFLRPGRDEEGEETDREEQEREAGENGAGGSFWEDLLRELR